MCSGYLLGLVLSVPARMRRLSWLVISIVSSRLTYQYAVVSAGSLVLFVLLQRWNNVNCCGWQLMRADRKTAARKPRTPTRGPKVIYVYMYYKHMCMCNMYKYVYIYIYVYTHINGSYSSVVRVSASGGGGPGFNPHHLKLSGLEVRPFKVSGGNTGQPGQELGWKTFWVKQNI